MNTLPPIEERIERLLKLTAYEVRPCKACGQMLYFVRHNVTGKAAPYTTDGINHFLQCSSAESFRRKKKTEVSA
jgi:hypothetical protein